MTENNTVAAKPASKISKIVEVAGLVGVSILFALLLVEVVLQLKPELLPPVIRTQYFMSDSESVPPGTVLDGDVGYRFKPNLSGLKVPFEGSSYLISTVDLGLGDVGFRDDGLTDDPYAVVLGDSMVACVGVNMDNCWVELLEQQTGRDFANLGMSGYGPDLQYRMLKKYGYSLNPQKVIWVFFANDVIQGWRFNQFGQGGVRQGEFWQNPVLGWLAEHSKVYITLAYLWYERNFFRNLYFGRPPVANNAPLSWWLAYTDLSVPEVARGLERSQEVLLDAYRDSRARNIEFTVVILPFREQVTLSGTEFEPGLGAAGQSVFEFCQKNDIPVIDLTPEFIAEYKRSSGKFFFNDSHLTVEGNRLMADILARQMEPAPAP